jgi:hypothetical protein
MPVPDDELALTQIRESISIDLSIFFAIDIKNKFCHVDGRYES